MINRNMLFLLTALLLAFTNRAESRLNYSSLYNNTNIDRFIRDFADCTTTAYQNVLYIVNSNYGFTCVEQDAPSNNYQLRFAECIVESNNTFGTILSEAEVAKISSMTIYSGPNDGEMWKICEQVVKQWSTLRNEKTILALTIEWDSLLADYPNGAFDVYTNPRYSNVDYWPVNFDNSLGHSLWGNTGEPVSTKSCELFSNDGLNSLIIHGTALYECLENEAKPQFLGCILGPVGPHNDLAQDTAFSFFVDELSNLRRLYSFVGFKSTMRPMEQSIALMNEVQLCSRLSFELYVQDTTTIPEGIMPTFYDESVYQNVYFSPGYKLRR